MNWAIDIFLALSVVLTIIIYAHRGFIKSLFALCKGILSLVLAYIFFPHLGKVISNILSINAVAANIISYIVIFIVSILALSILAFILDKIFSLPVLNKLNKILGFLLGAALAIFNLILTCSIITFILNIVQIWNPAISSSSMAEKTIVYGLISKIDFISYLIFKI